LLSRIVQKELADLDPSHVVDGDLRLIVRHR
jgi:hypothetical protein